MAQAIRSNRHGRAAVNAPLSSAFEIGIQPEQNENLATAVTTRNRKKFPLATKEGQVTDAGRYLYEELHKVPVPTLYQYEQPLYGTHMSEALTVTISNFEARTKMGPGLSQHQGTITSSTIVQNL